MRIVNLTINSSCHYTNKHKYHNIYRNLDEEKLWRLSTGKTVEKKCQSLWKRAFTEDKNWGDYFTEEELDEIRAHKSRELPTLPRELVNFLNSVKQMDIDEMHEFISGMYFIPTKDYICHCARKCLLEGIELFITDFFKGEDLTERDILSRVWRMILLAFIKEIRNCLEITWLAKMTLEETVVTQFTFFFLGNLKRLYKINNNSRRRSIKNPKKKK